MPWPPEPAQVGGLNVPHGVATVGWRTGAASPATAPRTKVGGLGTPAGIRPASWSHGQEKA